uniref:AlNc14C40G3414 protein n=1 Tax=Albugo laibachii Nc14 TaxID=890382 RepID=F0W9F5_9STRA|nr:AlNc14C40G3414 [Albugo laibachii Nc14]|eukprot:CCA17769.1 AlNc14C40G3414 [Albugo laibachii Nc14]
MEALSAFFQNLRRYSYRYFGFKLNSFIHVRFFIEPKPLSNWSKHGTAASMKTFVASKKRQLRSPNFGSPELSYDVDLSKLHPVLQRTFMQLDVDQETYDFLHVV